jgi:uncharacterized protein (TIGR03085 family)
MTTFARDERTALADTLRSVGPDAPTLCGEWRTRDLAAHLILRATRPIAATGIVLPGMSGHTRKVQDSIATSQWTALVNQVQYPPRWTPMTWGLLDDAANLAEYFVHHEDVLRADPEWGGPRAISPAYAEALWNMITGRGRFLFRRCPVGVVLAHPDGRRATVRATPDDGRRVTLAGEPGELVLFAYGRGVVANVEILGDAASIEAFRATKFRV